MEEEVSRAPHYPVYWDTWSTCGTCGFAVPSRYVIQTRKHGFQCLPGSGRTRGCFDGNYDRDDIYYIYPDHEGVREATSPLADQDRGMVFSVYVFRDTATGLLYSVDFSTTTLPLTLVTSVDWTTQNGPFDYLEANNGFLIYVTNGVLQAGKFATIYCPSMPGLQSTPSVAPAPGSTLVTPPGTISNGGPPINPPPFSLSCPSSSATLLVVNFTATPPVGFTVTNYHWDFGDGHTSDTGTVTTTSHTYATSGTYTVTLSVTTSEGVSGNSGSCPVTVSSCPDVLTAGGFTDPSWTKTILGTGSSYTATSMTAARSVVGGGLTSLDISKVIDSATWGTCTRLHVNFNYDVAIDVLGAGSPQAAIGFNYGGYTFEDDCTGSAGCHKVNTIDAVFTAPQNHLAEFTASVNGSMSGHATITINKLELLA